MDLISLNKKLKVSVDSNKEELDKLKNKYRKKAKEENNMPTSKKQSEKSSNTRSRVPETPLDEIVQIKKKKAVANELDELIFEQDQKKKVREQNAFAPQPAMMNTNPISELFSKNPEKIKDLSGDDIMKLGMLNATGKGNMNPLAYLMMSGKNESQGSGVLEVVQAVKELRGMVNEGQPQGGGNAGGMNDVVLAIIVKQLFDKNPEPAPRQERNSSDKVISELLSIINKKGDMERDMLMGEIKQLKYNQVSADPMTEAKKMIDFVSTYKSLFGSPTKETLSHDIELQRLRFDQEREMRKSEQSDARLEQVTKLIDKSIGSFADALAEPVAKTIKQGLEKYSQGNNTEEEYIPPTYTPEMPIPEPDYIPQEPTPQPIDNPHKTPRFRYAYTKDEEE